MTTLLAALTLAVCAVLLLRLVIGERARWRFDDTMRRATRSFRALGLSIWRWPATRRKARREADEAIRRARGGNGEWDGNIYKPDSFRKPRKPH